MKYRPSGDESQGAEIQDIGAEDSGEERTFSIIVHSAVLGPVAQVALPGMSDDVAAEVRRAMRANVERFGVTLRATLGRAFLHVGDILSLQSGDVIVLDRKADQAVEMTLQGKPVTLAFPATTGGYYSVQTSSAVLATERIGAERGQSNTKES